MDQKDSLTVSSRDFYEHARLKVALSIAAGGLCVFFLGMTSAAGGEARAAQLIAEGNILPDAESNAYELQSAGYGFGCFMFLLGFFASLGLAIYYSALISGSVNEKRTLKSPFEPEPVYSDAGSSHHHAGGGAEAAGKADV